MPAQKGPWGHKDLRYRTAKARIEFLRRIQDLYPKIAEDLQAKVPPELEEGGGAFSEALRAWGNRWNLADEWILVEARDRVLSSARPLQLGSVGMMGLRLPVSDAPLPAYHSPLARVQRRLSQIGERIR